MVAQVCTGPSQRATPEQGSLSSTRATRGLPEVSQENRICRKLWFKSLEALALSPRPVGSSEQHCRQGEIRQGDLGLDLMASLSLRCRQCILRAEVFVGLNSASWQMEKWLWNSFFRNIFIFNYVVCMYVCVGTYT